jgi:hypothetical protein
VFFVPVDADVESESREQFVAKAARKARMTVPSRVAFSVM